VVQDLELAVSGETEDDEVVEIDLNFDLSEEPEASEMRSREEIAMDVEDEQEVRNLAESADADEEEVAIDAEMIKGLIEELVFDHELTPNGTTGSNTAKIDEDHEIMRFKAEMEEKEKKEKELNENIQKLNANNSKLKRIILQLKEKLDEVSLSNAKLIYTNQTLTNASLNERQKNKIVESIGDAGTIEEAKVIFKTLQSTVQSAPNKRKPKSLDEVVEKGSSRLIYHNNKQENTFGPAVERMQRLAGIQKH